MFVMVFVHSVGDKIPNLLRENYFLSIKLFLTLRLDGPNEIFSFAEMSKEKIG